MRPLLFNFLFIVCFTSFAFCQKGQPAVGKIDKADLAMTDCSFDKGADAVKLIDYGNLFYDKGTQSLATFKTIIEKRVRIKVLKESGLTQADVTIPFYNHENGEKIVKFEGYTYNLDESGNVKTTEIKKSATYTKKINNYYSELVVPFPEVKVGSVIEYKYRMERESIELKDWYFQDKIPTRYSEYQIKVPLIFRFSVQPSVVNANDIDVKENVTDESINLPDGPLFTKMITRQFIMQNLIGIRNEPFMGSTKDYQQRLQFQLSQIDYGEGNVQDLRTSWKDAVTELLRDPEFGKQQETFLSTSLQDMINEAKKLPDDEQKIKFLHNIIRRSIKWDEEETQNDIYSDKGIDKAWEQKQGNTADINLLLLKLLNESGVAAYPILFSTRDHGLVNIYYPFLKQFNTVMVYVLLNGKPCILDATDKISNYKLTPEKIVNTKGFIVQEPAGKWIEMVDMKHKYKVMCAIKGEIDAEGMMRGDALVNCADYARKQRCEEWIADKEKFKRDHFSSAAMPVIIEDLAVNNVNADSLQLEQKAKFTAKLNGSGDYRYFNVNLFSDLDKNPFIQDERTTDVDFGFKQEYTIYGNFTIPENYTFDELPKNISLIMPDTSIVLNRVMQVENNLLNVRVSIEFQQTYYPASNYPEFKEFYKKLFALLNEQIVIKKKS